MHFKRITQSARGEVFNPLLWPFLFTTLMYGIGFVFLSSGFDILGTSSLYVSMLDIHPLAPLIWGISCIGTIVGGLTFLLFNIPPFGKISGLIGFSVWSFAGFCYFLTGNYLVLFAITAPNMWFWLWQYLSLSLFRRQEAKDRATLFAYNMGQYDDELNPKDSKIDREENRGKDRQTSGSYDNPDDGGDISRNLDNGETQ